MPSPPPRWSASSQSGCRSRSCAALTLSRTLSLTLTLALTLEQEPQLRIVRAVVELLGVATALDLLSRTEQVQAQGGMLVAETGKPRTS